ncbi:hypothetical protein [Amycolatopsis vastitatis]|uniref:Uncharacterized protein n=1 Tax=Amycolatopsis vastitatis TaxID=1905142 RepID=A0A229T4I1_9PSEU|nr:hypothetical protein [Amycolatopsis vastitatis]OXM65861.1 hypothetical protein CF165_20945 [Amycolatopsis vastitatis]
MATQRLRLVAPSGDRVTVGLSAAAPVSHVVAGVRFVGGSFGTGFQIGPRGYHDFACTYVAPAETRERLVVHGREVVVAEARDGQSSLATLIGTYHELMTVYAGPAPRRDRVLALFGSLRIEDHAGGMTVAPRAATLLDPANEHFVVVVKDHGALSIPAPSHAAGLLPRHAGARTRYGEVWKSVYAGDAARSFVLGCPAGVAEVHLADTAAKTERQRLDWLDEIDIAWDRR